MAAGAPASLQATAGRVAGPAAVPGRQAAAMRGPAATATRTDRRVAGSHCDGLAGPSVVVPADSQARARVRMGETIGISGPPVLGLGTVRSGRTGGRKGTAPSDRPAQEAVHSGRTGARSRTVRAVTGRSGRTGGPRVTARSDRKAPEVVTGRSGRTGVPSRTARAVTGRSGRTGVRLPIDRPRAGLRAAALETHAADGRTGRSAAHPGEIDRSGRNAARRSGPTAE